MKEMMDIKKSLYCAICDAQQQRNFIHDHKMIVLDNQFCSSIIKKHEGYLLWVHVELVKLIDLLYQNILCISTRGEEHKFPFQSVIEKYKRRLPFVERCIEAVNKGHPQYMQVCHFMCKQFKLQATSTFWDGDI